MKCYAYKLLLERLDNKHGKAQSGNTSEKQQIQVFNIQVQREAAKACRKSARVFLQKCQNLNDQMKLAANRLKNIRKRLLRCNWSFGTPTASLRLPTSQTVTEGHRLCEPGKAISWNRHWGCWWGSQRHLHRHLCSISDEASINLSVAQLE